MLVLSRKIGEVITIGNSITVTILSFDRGIVRVGIEAPKNISVHRREVYDKIIEMNKQAAVTDVAALKDAIGSFDFALPSANGTALITEPPVTMRHRKNGVHTNGTGQ